MSLLLVIVIRHVGEELLAGSVHLISDLSATLGKSETHLANVLNGLLAVFVDMDFVAYTLVLDVEPVGWGELRILTDLFVAFTVHVLNSIGLNVVLNVLCEGNF